jgi:GT2 family glycosyltransferase
MRDLSIIIVCHKGWEKLIKCLGALNLFSGEKFNTEVIIVDNKSEDETIYEIQERFPGFTFIFNDINGGFANGCNRGARDAVGVFLLFLNPDTVASESELQKLLQVAKDNPGFGIVSCKQVNENGRENIAYGAFPSMINLTGFQRAIFRNRKLGTISQESDIFFPDWISGSVVLIRNEIFTKLKGFDEDFWMYYEDVDLCRRVRDSNAEIAFCRNIIIEHNHGGSSRINLKTTALTKTEVQISQHIYINKHKKGLEKFIIQSFLVLNNLISGCIMALIGLILFFIPKIFLRTRMYYRLIGYYLGSVSRLSWISPRSVNFSKK